MDSNNGMTVHALTLRRGLTIPAPIKLRTFLLPAQMKGVKYGSKANGARKPHGGRGASHSSKNSNREADKASKK